MDDKTMDKMMDELSARKEKAIRATKRMEKLATLCNNGFVTKPTKKWYRLDSWCPHCTETKLHRDVYYKFALIGQFVLKHSKCPNCDYEWATKSFNA